MPLSRFKSRGARAAKAPKGEWGRDISTPAGRRMAHLHMHLVDHHLLRLLWTNLHEFAPGAWRANQPSPAQLARYKARGIRSVLNLRGAASEGFYLLEVEACAALGLTLESCHMASRSLVSRARMLDLLDIFDRIERPFLIHCKSGADRTGLAAALYLIHVLGVEPEVASRQLHWRFIHFRNGPSGVLDHMLDAYARDRRATGIAIRDWIATVYDPATLIAEWEALRAEKRQKK